MINVHYYLSLVVYCFYVRVDYNFPQWDEGSYHVFSDTLILCDGSGLTHGPIYIYIGPWTNCSDVGQVGAPRSPCDKQARH